MSENIKSAGYTPVNEYEVPTMTAVEEEPVEELQEPSEGEEGTETNDDDENGSDGQETVPETNPEPVVVPEPKQEPKKGSGRKG